jgi:hypothetical protein
LEAAGRTTSRLDKQGGDSVGEFNRSMQHHLVELLLLKGWCLWTK